MKRGGSPPARVTSQLVEALTLEALGRHADARAMLAAALRLGAQTTPRPGAGLGPLWWNFVLNDILASEAEAVILYDPIFPAQPFAR